MGNTLVLILFFIILPFCFWLNYRGSSTRRTARSDENFSSFHSVSIKPCSDACSSVKKLSRIRFLASKVSFLPLWDCDSKACTCIYVHYKDRRDGLERRFLNGIFASKEQRLTGNDRRKHGFI